MADGPSCSEATSSPASSWSSSSYAGGDWADGRVVPPRERHKQRHSPGSSSGERLRVSSSRCAGGGSNVNNPESEELAALKIASAVVLVERSEIEQHRIKQQQQQQQLANSSKCVMSSGRKEKDSKKDKDKDATGAAATAAAQQRKKPLATRAKSAAEKKARAAKAAAKVQQEAQAVAGPTAATAMVVVVGPCAKKRCADRYDSSESSDRSNDATQTSVVYPLIPPEAGPDQGPPTRTPSSGVAVSCGDCSNSSNSSSGLSSSGGSSTGSDITEPGSPCSTTSSDEGLGGGSSRSSTSTTPDPPSNSESSTSSSQSSTSSLSGVVLSSCGKLAPTQQQQQTQASAAPMAPRPHWPWTPPLAATACSNGYKRFKAEPVHGSLPSGRQPAQDVRQGKESKGAAGSGAGGGGGGAVGVVAGQAGNKTQKELKEKEQQQQQQQQPEVQGKITEYFKTQIKPQPPKTKKGQSSDMSLLAAKTSTEFRRPATVQRKNGLAKHHLSSRTSVDWEVRALSLGMRLNGKHADKKSSTTTTISNISNSTTTNNAKSNNGLPILPIPNDVLSTLPSCKISNLRLTSEASPSESPPPTMATPTSIVDVQTTQFKDNVHTPKPIHVNENNNLTSNSFGKNTSSMDFLSRLMLPSTPSDSTKDEDEESSRDSAASSKQSSVTSPSPILCEPTTIRFPVKAPRKERGQTVDSGFCRWDKCGSHYESSSVLLEHLQMVHINTQTGGDNFVCHWQGCKVHGKKSCSRRWLERHVLSHGGNKPFQCIVDGCGSRFSSQPALERHVNGHFNQTETASTASRKSTESGGKLVRRNGKKLRYRRQPWSARIFDYFDPGVMESLQHRLLELAQIRTQGRLAETPGDSMALTSQVLGRRVELDGKTRVLLRWYPEDIEPDEWVLESDVCSTKHVVIRKVVAEVPEEVNLALYPALNAGPPALQRIKQRRKPMKNT